MSHKKPTKEELAENIKNTAQELENDSNSPPAPEPDPEPSKPEPQPEPEPEPSTPAPEPEPSKPEPSPAVDYKKKFVDSTREAQVLHAQNKKINEAIESAMKLPEPPEEEMQKQFPEWDAMTDTEKRLAKDNYISSKRFAMLEEVTRESKDIESWNNKVDTFLADPQSLVDNPGLEGRVEDFKIFASKPTRRGADFNDLVSAFLYDLDKTAKPKNKGSMFETGTGGPNDKPKPKSDKITIDQARTLRTTDYKKYLEFLRAGKIDMSDL